MTLRICLLCNGETLPRWQARSLSHLLENADVAVTTIVYNEYEETRDPLETLRRGIELREWSLVAVLMTVFGRPTPLTDPVRIDSIVETESVEAHSVEPEIVDGWKQRIPTEQAVSIGDRSDVAIRFGFGFLVGDVLSAPEYGVLSFHHGDITRYRGQPMGFWEFVQDEPVAGITVQQLTEELDAGTIAGFRAVPIEDLRTWWAVKRRLFAESAELLTEAVRNVQEDDVEEPPRLGSLYSHPKGAPVLKYVVKNSTGYVTEVIGR